MVRRFKTAFVQLDQPNVPKDGHFPWYFQMPYCCIYSAYEYAHVQPSTARRSRTLAAEVPQLVDTRSPSPATGCCARAWQQRLLYKGCVTNYDATYPRWHTGFPLRPPINLTTVGTKLVATWQPHYIYFLSLSWVVQQLHHSACASHPHTQIFTLSLL